MPSGAKKRKAAKKKKEKEAYSNNSSSPTNDNNSQRNDDPKSQDERESDGGEVGSPSSQDNHQPPFSEGNDESENRVPLTDQSSVPESKLKEIGNAEGSEKDGLEDDGVIRIVRDYYEKDAENKDVLVQLMESKESHDGNVRSSSSSSSSSDDEKQAFKKKWDDKVHSLNLNSNSCNDEEKVVDSFTEEVAKTSENEKPLDETNSDAVVDTTVADLLMPVVPMSEEVEHVMEVSQVENTEVLDVVESGPLINEEKGLPTSVVMLPDKNEDKVYLILNENDGVSSNIIDSAINENEGMILAPTDCTTETSSQIENCEGSRTSDGTVDRKEDDVLISSDALTLESSTNTENAKGAETCECTEEKPLVAAAPHAAQRTSWMNCCGLFDAFTGSGR